MQDRDEQDHIRKQFAEQPGKGHLVEQLMGERENALTTGDDAAVIRVEDQLQVLGYQTPGQRASAAKARKDDAERREREAERVKANRGDAAARDDKGGDEDAQKASTGTGPSREEVARRQPPAARQSPAERKQQGSGPAKAKG